MCPRVTKSYKAEIRRRILVAAFKEFSLKGYAKTNLDRVADSVGIARGTIYLYYPSKQRLFEALSEFQLEKLRSLLEDHDWTSEQAGGASARSFFRETKRGLPENSERMAIEMLAESSRNKELKRQRLLETRKMQQIITEVIQAQMQNPSLTARETRELALGAIALYNGLNILRVLGYQDQEIEDSWTRTVSLIIEGTAKERRSEFGASAGGQQLKVATPRALK